MASQKDLESHKLDQQFRGSTIKAVPMPVNKEVASCLSGNPRRDTVLSAFNWMNPCNREKKSKDFANYSKKKIDWRNSKKERELFSSKIVESLTDKDIKKELADYREFELRGEAVAQPFALGAFQEVGLSEDELPLIITPKQRQYFNVNFIGQDGGARQAQWSDARSAEQHEMRTISTDKVEVPIMDIQQGNVNAMGDVQDQLRFDMDMQIDEEARIQIDALETASGLRDFLNFHRFIVQANVPDTNYLDLSGANAGVLTIDKIKQILRHVVRFGVGLTIDDDMSLSISSMVMSPQNIEDSWDFIDLVAGYNAGASVVTDPLDTVITPVREQIFNTGMMNSAWGINWTTVPNARLALGRMYVFMTKPVGWYFTKTQFDRLIVWDGPDQVDENYAQVVWRRVIQFVAPDLWRHRILIVDL